jgi:hypothetical protein
MRRQTLLTLSIPLLLAGCGTWRAQNGPPSEVVPANTASRLRIVRHDRSTLELREARVVGDSIVGQAGDPPVRVAVALADVERIDARRTSAARTGGLTLGVFAVVVLVTAAAATAALLGGWN